jgi:septal ring factor EnvC (AmiA/AmiB activator)
MLVFVFDPLAVMLVIAANQTLLRYGINLEKTGPDMPMDKEDASIDLNDDWHDSDFEEQARAKYGDNMPDLQDVPSAVEDAAVAMAESAAANNKKIDELEGLVKQLQKQKPEKVVIEKIIEKSPKLNIRPPKEILDLEKKISKRLDNDDSKGK